MSQGRFTASHWGIYGVETEGNRPKLVPWEKDPDPSPIGLHQLDDEVARLRVRRPAVRRSWLEQGPGAATHLRGREPFVEVGWDEALDLAAAEIERVRTEHGNSSIYGGSYGWASAGRFHHAQSQVHRFLNMAGGYVRSVDTYSLGAGAVIMPHVVAPITELIAQHTSWSVLAEHCELFVAFGGVPVKNTQMTPGGAAGHRVGPGLREMGRSGVKFVNISPVRDNLNTGAEVEWIPIRPNTDTALMLGLCGVLMEEGLHDRGFLDRYCTGFEKFAEYLDGTSDGVAKTADWAESITGVPAETSRALARRMAGSRTMVNVTWALQRAVHGEQPFWAVVALASMLGQIGLVGGGFGAGYGSMNNVGSPQPRIAAPTFPQGTNPVGDFIPVSRIADMLLNPGEPFTYNGGTYRYPDIRLVYWAGGNPYHHHQDLNRLEQAWARPDSVFINEPFWTATARHADIVFPVTSALERNDIGAATREGHLVAMKSVIEPHGEARDDFAIFSALSVRLGFGDDYTEGLDEFGWLRRMYERSAEGLRADGHEAPDFDTFWEQGIYSLDAWQQPVVMLEDFRRDPDAAPLNTPSGRIELFSETIASFGLADCPGHPAWLEPAEWLGAEATRERPLHLLSDQPVRRLHSQLDHSPYSVAGKINGREPVYMNSGDAAARGIGHGDLVFVSSGRGRCLAAALPSDDIMPGVARLATGAWFDPDPDAESPLERHGNPNSVTLDRGSSSLGQGCAAQTCLVEITLATPDAARSQAHDLPALERAL